MQRQYLINFAPYIPEGQRFTTPFDKKNLSARRGLT